MDSNPLFLTMGREDEQSSDMLIVMKKVKLADASVEIDMAM